MPYTTTDLLAAIKRKGMIPDSQVTFTDADLLSMADDEIRSHLVPAIMAAREDFFLTSIDYSTASTSYDIPSRAIGMKVKAVALVDANGSEQYLPVMDSMDASVSNGPQFRSFWIAGNQIRFQDAPTDTVRVYYYQKPSALVALSQCAVVSSVSGTTITTTGVPSNLTSSSTVDYVKGTAGYDLLGTDVDVSSVTATDVLVPSAPSPLLVAGCYITEAGYSPVVMIPEDLVGALEWGTVASILEAQGDLNGSALASQKADKTLAAGLRLFEPRVDGRVKKIINRDSELRRGFSRLHNNNNWYTT
jgi:hypothetical protein